MDFFTSAGSLIFVYSGVLLQQMVASVSDVTVELPFTLTHPKPPEEMMVSAVPRASPVNHALAGGGSKDHDSAPVDPNLIHIDTR